MDTPTDRPKTRRGSPPRSRPGLTPFWAGGLLVSVLLSSATLLADEARTSSPPTDRQTEDDSAPSLPDSLADEEGRGLRAVEAKATAQPQRLLVVGANILTAAGDTFPGGSVAIADGKITYVGATRPPLDDSYSVIDGKGKWITPGLIDSHSHLGVYPSPSARAHGDGNEATAPTTPGVWAEHSFWPQDPGIERAVAGGVTTIQVLPGSANLIGGRGVVLEMIRQQGSRAMRFPGAPETVKMACGENPKRVYGSRTSAPSTRMGNLRGQRTAFLKAEKLRRDWDLWEEKRAELRKKRGKVGPKKRPKRDESADSPPGRDLDLETLVGVLRGDILPQVHCYRADDMISMMQLAAEFGFSIRSFHHALEAYKIRDILAKEDIAASTWADWWGFKLEAYDGIPENAAMLHQAGGRAIIHSDSAVGIQRLNQEASKAMWSGRNAGIDIDEDDAIAWVSLNPAWALGIDHLTGSIAVGKRADLVLWDASPLSVYARAERVYIAGVLRYDRSNPGIWSDFEIGQGVVR
jgi:imidazolonepropionase-like amidohydrolase